MYLCYTRKNHLFCQCTHLLTLLHASTSMNMYLLSDHSDGAGDRSRHATNTNPLLETLQQQIHQQTRQLIEQKERQEKEFMDRQLYQMDSWDISWKGSSLGRGDNLKISLSPDDNLQTSVKSQVNVNYRNI